MSSVSVCKFGPAMEPMGLSSEPAWANYCPISSPCDRNEQSEISQEVMGARVDVCKLIRQCW